MMRNAIPEPNLSLRSGTIQMDVPLDRNTSHPLQRLFQAVAEAFVQQHPEGHRLDGFHAEFGRNLQQMW